MTEQQSTSAPTQSAGPAGNPTTATPGETRADLEKREQASVLITDQGRTSIADTVVSKIAGIACRETPGVHAVGGGAARAVGALRERIPGSRTNHSQGVGVEVGERQTAIDLDIVVEYGEDMAELASTIRRNVTAAVEKMSALEVTEVNITVHDVHLGDLDAEQATAAPTQRRVE
ncbi:Asp23/Gls24 family envelope stress response protein [Nocardioidaceae bacterium]|nr:Asp23/Gls24 family envelope stress response protein [Nocardioidaceae bacterium]